MHDTPSVASALRGLRAQGIHLAIDDFGTGYSSLSHLKRFPVDVLKIDQTFIHGLGRDPDDSAIVTAVIHLAHALGPPAPPKASKPATNSPNSAPWAANTPKATSSPTPNPPPPSPTNPPNTFTAGRTSPRKPRDGVAYGAAQQGPVLGDAHYEQSSNQRCATAYTALRSADRG